MENFTSHLSIGDGELTSSTTSSLPPRGGTTSLAGVPGCCAGSRHFLCRAQAGDGHAASRCEKALKINKNKWTAATTAPESPESRDKGLRRGASE